MLRDLIITLLLVIAVVVFFAGETATSILLLLLALAFIMIGANYNHILQKQLNFLAIWLLRASLTIAAITLFVILFAGDRANIAHYASMAIVGLLPLSLPLVIRSKFALSESQKAQHNAIKIIRSTLTSSAAQFSLVAITLIGLAVFNVPLVIGLPQLVLISLLLIYPLYSLKKDAPHHPLLKVSTHNLHWHTLTLSNLRQYLAYGSLAALCAYASYLMVFAVHNLSPRFIDPTLPIHTEAVTVATLTLLMCLLANILFERHEHHSKFTFDKFIQQNQILQTMLITLVIFIVLILLPGVNSLLGLSLVGFTEWSISIVLTGLYIGLRCLQIHTRKHTRGSVIELHHQAN